MGEAKSCGNQEGPLCQRKRLANYHEKIPFISACAYEKIRGKIMLVTDEIYASYWLDL